MRPSPVRCAPPAWYNVKGCVQPDAAGNGPGDSISGFAAAPVRARLPDARYARRCRGRSAGRLLALAVGCRRRGAIAQIVPHHDSGAAGARRIEGRAPATRNLRGSVAAGAPGGTDGNATRGNGRIALAGFPAPAGIALPVRARSLPAARGLRRRLRGGGGGARNQRSQQPPDRGARPQTHPGTPAALCRRPRAPVGGTARIPHRLRHRRPLPAHRPVIGGCRAVYGWRRQSERGAQPHRRSRPRGSLPDRHRAENPGPQRGVCRRERRGWSHPAGRRQTLQRDGVRRDRRGPDREFVHCLQSRQAAADRRTEVSPTRSRLSPCAGAASPR